MSDLELTDIDGVGPGRASTLTDEGFETVGDVAFSSVEDIAGSTGIPETTIESIIESATDLLEDVDGGDTPDDGGDGSDEDADGRSDGGDGDGGFTPIEPDELDPFGVDVGGSVGVDSAAEGEYLLELDMDRKLLMHVIHVVLEDATKKEQKAAFEFRDYQYRVGRKLMAVATDTGEPVDTAVSMTRMEIRMLYRALNQGRSDYSSRSNAGDLWGGLEQFREEVNEIRE